MSLDNDLKRFKKLLEDIKKYNDSPDPIVVDEKQVMKGLSGAIQAALPLISPKAAIVGAVLKIVGKFLDKMSEK